MQIYKVEILGLGGTLERKRIESSSFTFKVAANGPMFRKGDRYEYESLTNGEWTRVLSNEYPETESGRTKAWNRAKHQPTEYNLLSFNCEHFVTWALTGSARSRQVKDLQQRVVG